MIIYRENGATLQEIEATAEAMPSPMERYNILFHFKCNYEFLKNNNNNIFYSENGPLDLCGICNLDFAAGVTNKVTCSQCQMEIHLECSMQFTKTDMLCKLCFRGATQVAVQSECYKKQKLAAEKMTTYSKHLFPPLDIGSTIMLAVPSVDRAPLDFQNVLGVVMASRNDVYQVGTTHGILKGWFNRTDINLSGTQVLKMSDVPQNVHLSLREAAAKQSLTGGQGLRKCACRESGTQCKTNRCTCFKAKVLCSSRCHLSAPCANK